MAMEQGFVTARRERRSARGIQNLVPYCFQWSFPKEAKPYRTKFTGKYAITGIGIYHPSDHSLTLYY